MLPLSAFILALLSTVVFINLLLKFARKYKLYDVPGGRKIHRKPVPRLGGVGMAAGTCLPIFVWLDLNATFKSILMGMSALAIMGLIDDLFELKWSRKMLVQAVAALVVVIYGKIQIVSLGFWAGHEVLLPAYLSIPLTFLFILGVTNAINLADGLDGLAGGLCTFVFGFFMVIACIRGLENYLLPLAAILGSIWGFLRFNTHPAIIFMGDAGSYFLGFSAAVFGLVCTQTGEHSAVSPAVLLLILAIPVTDTLTVMTERFLSGESMFLPDKRHLHFRLIDAGLSHGEAVVAIYVLQTVFTLLAFRYLFYPAPIITGLFVLSIILLFGGLKFIEIKGWKFRKREKDKSASELAEARIYNIVTNTARYLNSILLSLFLVIPPFLPSLRFDKNATYFLIIPILMSVVYFLRGGWFAALSRGAIYCSSIFIAETILTHEYSKEFSYLGMPLWYILFLVTLTVTTVFYLKFAFKKNIKLTPFDLLIFLVTLAFTILPMHFDFTSSTVHQLIISMIVFVYASETALDQGSERRKILVFAAIFSTLVMGIRGILSLIQGL